MRPQTATSRAGGHAAAGCERIPWWP